MIIAFQVILLLIIVISFTGVIGEKQNMDLQEKLLVMFLGSLASFLASVFWL